ncbi:TPA: hypothetical protein ACXNIA_004638 [Pseudomonas aeruginosa]
MQVNHGEHPDVDIPRAPQPRGFQQRATSNAQLAYDRAVDPLWDQPEPEPEHEDEEQEDDDGLQQ